jgi:hypothetical protein
MLQWGMPPRMVDTYPIGTNVEITFDGETWYRGVVVKHDHPAVWVQTGDGGLWFVTNGRKIRQIEINQ